jgi:hypothetical protein
MKRAKGSSKTAAPVSAAILISPNDRAAAGKALREKLPREHHGGWKEFTMACGWVLARAHSKVSEISATISGYLSSSSDEFDQAMGKFAVAYADQAERDHAALKAAVRKGKVTVYQET